MQQNYAVCADDCATSISFFHSAGSIKNNKQSQTRPSIKGGRVWFQLSNLIAFLSQEGDGDIFEKVACQNGSV